MAPFKNKNEITHIQNTDDSAILFFSYEKHCWDTRSLYVN